MDDPKQLMVIIPVLAGASVWKWKISL
jgi:hypothetical protein